MPKEISEYLAKMQETSLIHNNLKYFYDQLTFKFVKYLYFDVGLPSNLGHYWITCLEKIISKTPK